MATEHEEFEQLVARQCDELVGLLAQIGIAGEYDLDVEIPEEGQPLTELFVAVKVVADHLEVVVNELRARTEEAQRYAETVRAQSSAILELSTPVLQVLDEVLVVPLIGTVDTHRSGQLLEQLLEGVARFQASVVIVDITGVPVVDTAVASHLMKTVRAARMLGAECLLTGVSPEIAQTVVKAGVDTGELVTKGTLRAGLRYAMARTRDQAR
jgi:rsbT co-antagonist protein RsbR